MKKIIFDIIFIVISTVILVLFSEFGLLEKYIGFALIPIMIAYYLGQFIERKTRDKSK